MTKLHNNDVQSRDHSAQKQLWDQRFQDDQHELKIDNLKLVEQELKTQIFD